MEHRYSERTETNVKVVSYKNGTPVAAGRIKNFSSYGFFMETNPKELQFLQRLEIELIPESDSPQSVCVGSEPLRYYGCVTRKTSEGIGIELEAMSRESAQALRALCSAAAKKNSYAGATAEDLETPSTEVVEACCRNWQQLDTALAQIVGRHALDAIYKNALGVASLEFPWLALAQKGVLSADNFSNLQKAMTKQTSAFVLAANAAFYSAFEKLLAGLIGECLTERLLNSGVNTKDICFTGKRAEEPKTHTITSLATTVFLTASTKVAA